MYQWTEPGTESTQLSGKPPSWYRSVAGGPRVFVFDDGRLVDDTAVEVSEEVRQRLRQQAFILAEEDRQMAKEKMVRAQELKQKYENDLEKDDVMDLEEDNDRARELLDEALALDEDDPVDDDPDEKSLDELRDMIAEWEKAQSESAKKALQE